MLFFASGLEWQCFSFVPGNPMYLFRCDRMPLILGFTFNLLLEPVIHSLPWQEQDVIKCITHTTSIARNRKATGIFSRSVQKLSSFYKA